MFQHRLHEEVSTKTYIHWFILSFLAGNINAGGYLSCHRFVSHITGFATLSGVSFGLASWLEAFGSLFIPLFFLMGVMVSAYLIERDHARKVHGQKYAPVMGAVAVLLAIVAIGGFLDWFGDFGDPAKIKHDFLLLACLCGACGLQNGAITLASGATIRTTHLTGLTTDLGLGLVKVNFHKLTNEQRNKERKENLLRIGAISAFFLGSVVGAIVFIRFKYAGFFLPMAISIYFAFIAKKSYEVNSSQPN